MKNWIFQTFGLDNTRLIGLDQFCFLLILGIAYFFRLLYFSCHCQADYNAAVGFGWWLNGWNSAVHGRLYLKANWCPIYFHIIGNKVFGTIMLATFVRFRFDMWSPFIAWKDSQLWCKVTVLKDLNWYLMHIIVTIGRYGYYMIWKNMYLEKSNMDRYVSIYITQIQKTCIFFYNFRKI